MTNMLVWSLKSILLAGVTRQHGIKVTGKHSELNNKHTGVVS